MFGQLNNSSAEIGKGLKFHMEEAAPPAGLSALSFAVSCFRGMAEPFARSALSHASKDSCTNK
eukprot:2866178-Alexandrium_andersonii.AAC.1